MSRYPIRYISGTITADPTAYDVSKPQLTGFTAVRRRPSRTARSVLDAGFKPVESVALTQRRNNSRKDDCSWTPRERIKKAALEIFQPALLIRQFSKSLSGQSGKNILHLLHKEDVLTDLLIEGLTNMGEHIEKIRTAGVCQLRSL